MQIVAAGSTARRVFILGQRGCLVFIQDIGEIGFPALREHVRGAVEHEKAIDLSAKAALA